MRFRSTPTRLCVLLLLSVASIAGAQTPASVPTQAQRDYATAESGAMKSAVAMYPDAGVKGSALNNGLQARAVELRKTNPDFFKNPNWPLFLATQTAGELGILPNVLPAAPPAAAVAPPTQSPKLAPPAPAVVGPPQTTQFETQVPAVSAKTTTAGNREATSVTGSTTRTQAMHVLGVDVQFRFFRPLTAPVDLQCFFVARNEGTGARFIFESSTLTQRTATGDVQFTSSPLAGTVKEQIFIPITGTFSDGSTFTGQATSSTSTMGSKAEGWVIRFVSGGHVLKVGSNQPFLTDLALKTPAIFDKAVSPPQTSQ